jgi:hypothetical protein
MRQRRIEGSENEPRKRLRACESEELVELCAREREQKAQRGSVKAPVRGFGTVRL